MPTRAWNCYSIFLGIQVVLVGAHGRHAPIVQQKPPRRYAGQTFGVKVIEPVMRRPA